MFLSYYKLWLRIYVHIRETSLCLYVCVFLSVSFSRNISLYDSCSCNLLLFRKKKSHLLRTTSNSVQLLLFPFPFILFYFIFLYFFVDVICLLTWCFFLHKIVRYLKCLWCLWYFICMIQELEKKKPVILTGDLNCAHQEIDIYNPAVSDLKFWSCK